MRVPKRHQATSRKQSVREELAKKKKRQTTPLPRKRGGIMFREPTARRKYVADESDDEDGGEMLQQRAAHMATPALTTGVGSPQDRETVGRRAASDEIPERRQEAPGGGDHRGKSGDTGGRPTAPILLAVRSGNNRTRELQQATPFQGHCQAI